MDAASTRPSHASYAPGGDPGAAPAHASSATSKPPDDDAVQPWKALPLDTRRGCEERPLTETELPAYAQKPLTFGIEAFRNPFCSLSIPYYAVLERLRDGTPPRPPSVSVDAACARFQRFHKRCRDAITLVFALADVPADDRRRIVNAQVTSARQFKRAKENCAAGWSGYLVGASPADVIQQIDALADNRAQVARVYETSARLLESQRAARQAEASAAQAAQGPVVAPASGVPVAEGETPVQPAPPRAPVIVPKHPSPSLEAAISRAETMVNQCFALRWPARMQSDVEKLFITSGIDLDMIDRFKHAAAVRRASWIGWPLRWHPTQDLAVIDRYAAAVAKVVILGHEKARILNGYSFANATIAFEGRHIRFVGTANDTGFAYLFLDFFKFVLRQSNVIAALNLNQRFGV